MGGPPMLLRGSEWHEAMNQRGRGFHVCVEWAVYRVCVV